MMVKMILEIVFILVSMILATALKKKNFIKAQKIFAISFVLAFAVLTAFTLVQLSTQFKLLDITLAYTPLDVLSLFAVIFWVSFFSAQSTFFDKLIEE